MGRYDANRQKAVCQGAIVTVETFSTRLASLMGKAGVDIAGLGNAAGFSRQTLHKLLRGERQPSLDTARRLAVALGKSLAVFDKIA